MSLESSTPNTPQQQPEKKPTTNAFLREQIRLPEEEWSPEFRRLVDEKAKELALFMAKRQRINRGEETETEESPEVEREYTFRRYLKQLGLHEEALRGKRIMDLGCAEGEFVKHLISKGITSEAYGIDIQLDSSSIEGGFDGHLFKRSMEEDLPVQDLDYIVSIQAIWPDDTWGGDNPMNIETILEKSLSALKQGGEMRTYPIDENAKRNSNRESADEQQKKWSTVLPMMAEKYGLTYEFEPINIFVNSENGDVTLQSVLIIKKQVSK